MNNDILQKSNLYKVVAQGIIDLKEDLLRNNYVLDEKDHPIIVNTFVETAKTFFKSTQLPEEYLESFILENGRNIRLGAIDRIEQEFDAMLQKSAMMELTYHPDHIMVHEAEEAGRDVNQDFLKSRWHDIPSELRDHLERYHFDQKVWHVHTPDLSNPLIFSKSVDTQRIEQSTIHEQAHRLDEKALREEEVTEEEQWTYSDMYKSAIMPGMIWNDGVIVNADMADHLNSYHGPAYQPHPLELPMIGPASQFAEYHRIREELQKSQGYSDEFGGIVKGDPLEEVRDFFMNPIAKGFASGAMQGVGVPAPAAGAIETGLGQLPAAQSPMGSAIKTANGLPGMEGLGQSVGGGLKNMLSGSGGMGGGMGAGLGSGMAGALGAGDGQPKASGSNLGKLKSMCDCSGAHGDGGPGPHDTANESSKVGGVGPEYPQVTDHNGAATSMMGTNAKEFGDGFAHGDGAAAGPGPSDTANESSKPKMSEYAQNDSTVGGGRGSGSWKNKWAGTSLGETGGAEASQYHQVRLPETHSKHKTQEPLGSQKN